MLGLFVCVCVGVCRSLVSCGGPGRAHSQAHVWECRPPKTRLSPATTMRLEPQIPQSVDQPIINRYIHNTFKTFVTAFWKHPLKLYVEFLNTLFFLSWTTAPSSPICHSRTSSASVRTRGDVQHETSVQPVPTEDLPSTSGLRAVDWTSYAGLKGIGALVSYAIIYLFGPKLLNVNSDAGQSNFAHGSPVPFNCPL